MKKPVLSITYKILTAFAIVLLLTIITLGMTFTHSRNEMEDQLLANIQRLADEREAYILMFLELNKRRMVDFSTDDYVVTALEKIAKGDKASGKKLGEYLKKYKLPIYKEMYRMNIVSAADGTIVASTIGGMEGENIADTEYFKRGREGVVVVEVTRGYKDMPEVAVSAPVYSRNDSGRLLGVITGFSQLEMFGEFFTGEYIKGLGALTYSPVLQWKTMDMYLVNRDKLMLTKSWLLPEPTVLRQKVDTEPVSACLEESREITGIYKDYRDQEVAGASMCFPSLGWTLLVEVDTVEVFAPAESNWRLAILSVFGVIILIAIMVLYIMRSIVVQLKKLAAGAGEIAEGNYDIKIPVKSRDEIGYLAASFNNMAAGVKERTEELKESRRRLAESEALLRYIMDNMGNLSFIKDLEGRYLFVNRLIELTFKMKKEEFYGKNDFDIFPKEKAEEYRRNDKSVIENDLRMEFEESALLEDGLRTYLSIKFPLKDIQGKTYGICGVSTEITQLKRTEETLRKNEHLLSEAQRIARIGSWERDMVNNKVYWSDEVYSIFGLKPQEFEITYEKFMEFVHPDERRRIIELLDSTISKKTSYSIDYSIVLRDGAEKIVHSQAETEFDRDGRLLRLTSTVQDITELKKAENDLRRLTVELERRVEERTKELRKTVEDLADANRDIETFTYSVAHDLRAPLRLIDAFSMALERTQKDRLDPEGRDNLTRIRKAATRMGQLIEDLLNLSQVMRSEIAYELIDLTGLASAIAADFTKAEPDRKVDFKIQPGLKALGDKKLIRMMLENLLGNAWKFTSRTEKPEIEFKGVGQENGREIFVVKDNGAGFNMKYYSHLFMPFQRLHSADEYPGTGIGLATVQRIIQMHDGKVWAEGEPDRGAAFYFTLKKQPVQP